MDIHQLEVFITAAQYLNFTEASKHLDMVPSAVSHNIAMLENELSTKLFRRNKNKLTLTLEGKAFLADAYKMTTIANNAISRIKTTKPGETGELQVGFVFPEFIEIFLPEMTNFYNKYPSIETYYMQYNSITISRMLEKNTLDIAFGRKDMFSPNSKIQWKSLYRDPFKVVMHRDNPLAQYNILTPQMLKHQQILVMNRASNPGMFDMISHLFLANGIVPLINDHSNHHHMTLLLAGMNAGIVIIPFQNIRYMNLPEVLVCKDLDDRLAFHEIGIAWNQTTENPSVKYFLKEFHVDDPEP